MWSVIGIYHPNDLTVNECLHFVLTAKVHLDGLTSYYCAIGLVHEPHLYVVMPVSLSILSHNFEKLELLKRHESFLKEQVG